MASVDISPQSQLEYLLTSSHMATCIGISSDRERILTTYPSEPILSEAAFWIIESDETLVKILQLFAEILKNGFVDAGQRGEVVGRLILTFCWQACVKAQTSIKPQFYTTNVKMDIFLNTLLGDEYNLKCNISEDLLDGN